MAVIRSDLDDHSLVETSAFTDEDVYRRELDRIFARCWLVVGHESMIPKPGDYITNFMGEDPVIVARDGTGQVRVSLNRCTHRGNKLCLFDRGSAKAFTCSYHAWTFRNDGELIRVPEHEARYGDALDVGEWGLPQARVAEHAGFIFACWEPKTEPLADYLGDFRYYLDAVGDVSAHGLEVLPGRIRFRVNGNWKMLSENLAGDHYHTPYSHASALKVNDRTQPGMRRGARRMHDPRRVSVSTGVDGAVPHSLMFTPWQSADVALNDAAAGEVGPDAVEWLAEYRSRAAEAGDAALKSTLGRNVGNIFPNTCWAGGSPFGGKMMFQWQPKGPHHTEGWCWAMVPKDAPESVKRYIAIDLSRGQSPAGNVQPDDAENFERIDQGISSAVSARTPLAYRLGMGGDGPPEVFAEQDISALPGAIRTDWAVGERNQRAFYEHWSRVMSEA